MNQDDENERLLAEIERLRELLRFAIIDAKIAAQLRLSIQRNGKMAAALQATLTYLDENGSDTTMLYQQVKDALDGCDDAELRQYMPTVPKRGQAQ
ncbi:hypothetical protein [Bradyrhizobium sp. URHC0002]